MITTDIRTQIIANANLVWGPCNFDVITRTGDTNESSSIYGDSGTIQALLIVSTVEPRTFTVLLIGEERITLEEALSALHRLTMEIVKTMIMYHTVMPGIDKELDQGTPTTFGTLSGVTGDPRS